MQEEFVVSMLALTVFYCQALGWKNLFQNTHVNNKWIVLLQSLHQQFTVYEVIHIYRIEIIYRVNTSVEKVGFRDP